MECHYLWNSLIYCTGTSYGTKKWGVTPLGVLCYIKRFSGIVAYVSRADLLAPSHDRSEYFTQDFSVVFARSFWKECIKMGQVSSWSSSYLYFESTGRISITFDVMSTLNIISFWKNLYWNWTCPVPAELALWYIKCSHKSLNFVNIYNLNLVHTFLSWIFNEIQRQTVSVMWSAFQYYMDIREHSVAYLVEALHYNPKGRVLDWLWGYWIFFFSLPNPPSRTMALRSTQPLTEMSTRNILGGKRRPAGA
jgi:hypothetical protein